MKKSENGSQIARGGFFSFVRTEVDVRCGDQKYPGGLCEVKWTVLANSHDKEGSATHQLMYKMDFLSDEFHSGSIPIGEADIDSILKVGDSDFDGQQRIVERLVGDAHRESPDLPYVQFLGYLDKDDFDDASQSKLRDPVPFISLEAD